MDFCSGIGIDAIGVPGMIRMQYPGTIVMSMPGKRSYGHIVQTRQDEI